MPLLKEKLRTLQKFPIMQFYLFLLCAPVIVSPKSADVSPWQLSSSDSFSIKLPETLLSRQELDQFMTVASTGCLSSAISLCLSIMQSWQNTLLGPLLSQGIAFITSAVPLPHCLIFSIKCFESQGDKHSACAQLWGFFHLMQHVQMCFLSYGHIRQRTYVKARCWWRSRWRKITVITKTISVSGTVTAGSRISLAGC